LFTTPFLRSKKLHWTQERVGSFRYALLSWPTNHERGGLCVVLSFSEKKREGAMGKRNRACRESACNHGAALLHNTYTTGESKPIVFQSMRCSKLLPRARKLLTANGALFCHEFQPTYPHIQVGACLISSPLLLCFERVWNPFESRESLWNPFESRNLSIGPTLPRPVLLFFSISLGMGEIRCNEGDGTRYPPSTQP
jgi:hypothetical protein